MKFGSFSTKLDFFKYIGVSPLFKMSEVQNLVSGSSLSQGICCCKLYTCICNSLGDMISVQIFFRLL
jgi:hypothetical protein